MRTVVQWVVFALLAYVSWQVGPPYVHSRQFTTELEEVVRRNHGEPQAVVVERAVESAQSLDLPLTADGVTVRRNEHHTYVDATHTKNLQVLPGFTYAWTVTTSVDGYTVRPQTASDVIGPR